MLCGAARAGVSLNRWADRLHDPANAPVLDDLRERHLKTLSGSWQDAPQGLDELSSILNQMA